MNVDQIIKDRIAEKLKFFLLPGQHMPRSVQVIVSYDGADARLNIDIRDITEGLTKGEDNERNG